MKKKPIAVGLLVACGVSLAGSVPLAAWAQPPAAPPTVAPAPPPAQAVNVRVNGEALPFPGQGAIQRGGAVLVPLRGIFEKLGAEVKFDPPTGQITAVKLDTTVKLKVGDTTGYINDLPRPLSTPATVYNGTVLIPLRLVSDAFGATIAWDSRNLVADITTDAINAAKLPTPPNDDSSVTGVLTGVYPEISAVTVRVVTSENVRVLLARAAEVQIKQVGEVKERVTLNDLRIGDQVVLKRNRGGFVNVVNVLRDLRRGVIKEKKPLDNGNTQILFTNGGTVELEARAPVLMNGNLVQLSDVRVNEGIVVRLNLETGRGISAAVISPNDPNPIPPDADTVIEEQKPPIPVDPPKPATPDVAPASCVRVSTSGFGVGAGGKTRDARRCARADAETRSANPDARRGRQDPEGRGRDQLYPDRDARREGRGHGGGVDQRERVRADGEGGYAGDVHRHGDDPRRGDGERSGPDRDANPGRADQRDRDRDRQNHRGRGGAGDQRHRAVRRGRTDRNQAQNLRRVQRPAEQGGPARRSRPPERRGYYREGGPDRGLLYL
jgi:hypothetical protein